MSLVSLHERLGPPCEHGYPAGEFCPACGEVPVIEWDEEHALGCECFACDEGGA